MKIAIVGGGAIGSLFAAKLSSHGDVHLLTSSRADHVEMIAQKGLLIKSPQAKDQVITGIKTIVPEGTLFDIIVFTVKAPYTRTACQKYCNFLAPGGFVVSVQNGMGLSDIYKEYFTKVVYAVTYQACFVQSPGVIVHSACGDTFLSTNGGSTELFATLMNQSDMTCLTRPTFESVQWGKLLVNAGINPVAAFFGIANGKMLDKDLRGWICRFVMRRIVREGSHVAMKLGISLPFPDPIKKVTEVIEATKHNMCSMAIDVSKGNPTEIDFINGYIVKTGKSMDVRTFWNKTAVRLLQYQRWWK
jgi:2-dehydropantoate 2-reductase